MSDVFQIPAELRDDSGKGASRRLRRQGFVPGILYGLSKDAIALQLENRFMVKALEEESFYTSILEITVGDGRKQKVILRDLQRHPFKSLIMHVDFQRISDTELMRIQIPLHFENEDASPAEKMTGVVISHQVTEIEVSCLPTNLPEFLTLDLAKLEPGEMRHLSDIRVPNGVELVALSHGDDQIVVSAQHVTVQAEPEADEEAPSPEVPTTSEAQTDSDDDSSDS